MILSPIILKDEFQQLDAALRAYQSGDATGFAELVAGRFAVEVRELIRSAIISPPNLGRPRARRNEYGATDRLAKLVSAYERFWGMIENDASYDEAKCAARKLCVTTDTELDKLIWNKITLVNEITREKGTLRDNPTKRFSELQKTRDQNARG